MRALPLKLVLEPGISERDLAQRYAEAAAQLYPMVDPLVSNLLALHLRHATQSEVVSALERSGGQLPGSREVAVCFADLVGFTRLGEEVAARRARPPGRAPGGARHRSARRRRCGWSRRSATPRCSPRPSPSRCSTPRSTLLDAADAEGEDFPQLRAGAALGAALPRAGDWFGRPVNLASRITAIARPGSLLAEREVRESARGCLPLVLRGRAAPARHPRAGAAVPRAGRLPGCASLDAARSHSRQGAAPTPTGR